jgi:hypothetical protein
MNRFLFSAAFTAIGLAASTGFACNRVGGGSSGASSGGTGTAALGSTSGLRSGLSMNSSPFGQRSAMQQSALRQLVAQRALQQQYQQLLGAQQQLRNDQRNRVTTTRAEQLKQAREDKIAKRKGREAEQLAKREALKAQNLAKRAAKGPTTQVATDQ